MVGNVLCLPDPVTITTPTRFFPIGKKAWLLAQTVVETRADGQAKRRTLVFGGIERNSLTNRHSVSAYLPSGQTHALPDRVSLVLAMDELHTFCVEHGLIPST